MNEKEWLTQCYLECLGRGKEWHELATLYRRRLNRLVIREASTPPQIHTRAGNYSDSDAVEYLCGSATLRKEYGELEVSDPEKRKEEIKSWYGELWEVE